MVANPSNENPPVEAGPRPRGVRHSLLLMVLAGLVLRLVVMCFLYPERTDPFRDHWRFGGEAGRIARALAQGQGFSNPLFAETGPTAWLSPVFPFLLSCIFRIFGIYTKAAAVTALSLGCLLSALTAIPIYFIARRTFGNATAAWAGWAWAFFPYAIYFSADFIWATALTTLIMTCVFLLTLKLEDTENLALWAGFGVLSGLGGLTDPVVLSAAPFLGAWAWYRLWRSGKRWLLPGVTAVLAVTLTVAPWFIRNYRTFHKVIPFRSCLGLELYCGNNMDSWHWGPPGYHPSDSESEWREYQQLGESEYTKRKMREGLRFIDAHRGLYLTQTLRRVVYMWTGYWSFGARYLKEEPMDPANIVFCVPLTILTLIGLRRAWNVDARLAVPYLIVFFFFPLVYYFTHPEDYYRRPIDPLFVVLSAYAVVTWLEQRRGAKQLIQPSGSR